MEQLLRPGDLVRRIEDPSQDRRDRYGRLLAYVERSGRDVGRAQVRAGLAATYVFDPSSPPRRADVDRAVQARAKTARVGVYELCGGDFHAGAD